MGKFLLCALLLGAALDPSLPAHAQAWPQRPITIVVSQPAGNSPDVFCRIITERLGRALGQGFVVDNRPGAANMIGTQAVARAAPDGYTFLFATAAALVANPYTFKTLSYDPVRDFIPVATIAKSNFILLVNPTVQAKTLPELIALDKSAPGKLSLAVDGPRNASGILGQYINKMAGSSMVLVPYNNNSTALQDTIAGRIQVTIQAASVAESFIKEATLRPIAVASPQRLAWLPDVSTMAETLPGVQLQGWFMIMAPAKTPVEIVSKLNQEIVRVLADPEVKQRAATLGFEIDPAGSGTPAGAADFLKSELALWGKVTREVGLEPQ